MGNPDVVLSPYRPDPFPYDILVYRTLPNGKIKSTGFRLAATNQWNSRQANQRVARMQTGDRKMHDFSLLNVQVWDRLSDGGVGALEGADSTRYAWSENVFAGDAEGIKLAPITNLLENFLTAGESIVDFFLWPGPQVTNRSAGANDGWLVVIATNHTANSNVGYTKIYRVLPNSDGAVVTTDVNLVGLKALHTCLHRNKLYISQGPAAEVSTTTCIHEIKWNGSAWVDTKIKGDFTGEHLYSDGKWFYKTLGNLVWRTADVYVVGDSGTITWQGPVWVGDGSPINNLVTYGSDEGRAVYVVTWKGLYRILEESGEIKHANPVDERSGTADDEHGLAFELANNEIIWNYPRGLLRHSLGQTQGSSPWEDEGVPISQRGLFGDLQDGVGGIYIACNPIGSAKATIYRWQEQRWHSFLVYQDPLVQKIKRLYWTTRQVADTARLWVLMQYNGVDRLAWLPMPTSTQNYRLLPSVSYPPQGSLTFPRFKSELADLQKNFASVSLDLLDNGSVGTGVVEVLGTTLPGKDTVSYTSYGTYTCVPTNGLTLSPTAWVPCKAGQSQHDRLPLNLQSKEIQLQLKLKRGVGSAYPDTGLSDPDGSVLDDGTVLLWGRVTGGDLHPNEAYETIASCPWALLSWSRDRWVRIPLDAARITGVLDIDSDSIWVSGYLAVSGVLYGLVRYNRSTGVVTPEKIFKDLVVTHFVNSDGLAIAFTQGPSYQAFQIPDTGIGQWVAKHSFNGMVNLARHIGSSVIVTGQFTEVTWSGIRVPIDSKITRIDFASGQAWGIQVAGLDPQAIADTRDIVPYSNGKIYFAAGNIGNGGRIWSVVNEAALTNACTFTAVSLSIPNGNVVSSIAPDAGFGMLIGLADGSVYQQDVVTPTNPWTEVVDTPWNDDLHPVRRFLAGGQLIVCDYRNQITSRGRHALDMMNVQYQAGQLVFVPHPVGETTMPTPVVERTALWFVEYPIELMQYGLPLNPSSDTTLLDMSIDPRSAAEIWEELHYLSSSHQFVTAIMPDRKAYRGWFSALTDMVATVNRGNDGAPVNEQHMTEVQFNQVEELHQPVRYLAPGIHDG